MAYLAVLGASIGRRAGFAATLGVALGLLIVGLAAALGLAAVIANSRVLYEALRWAGVLYLFWLAWEAWRRGHAGPGHAPFATQFFSRYAMLALPRCQTRTGIDHGNDDSRAGSARLTAYFE
jgi:threonine/homoserine/homoserine lactone efflux protein